MDVLDLVTPNSCRRNPPRKARLSFIGKSTKKALYNETKSSEEPRVIVASFASSKPDGVKIKEEEPQFEIAQSLELKGISISPVGSNDSKDQIPIKAKLEDKEEAILHLGDEHNGEPLAGLTDSDKHCSTLSLPGDSNKKLLVFLRIRPAQVTRFRKDCRKTDRVANLHNKFQKGVDKPGGKRKFLLKESASAAEISHVPAVCLHAQGPHHVTLVPPASLAGSRRPKTEDYDGFSQVFKADSTQAEVFSTIMVPRLKSLLKGENALVVAMGPTSAGKTHTMLGSQKDPGLLPRSLKYLLDEKKNSVPNRIVFISMFEIYSEQGGRCEKILDLLQEGIELSLQHSQPKGLLEAASSTAQEAEAILSNGLQKRTTACTAANDRSSRSHCVIKIRVSQTLLEDEGSNIAKEATLTIVDLAGFEREKKTGNQGLRLNESNFINNTSMVFGQCLRALLEHQKYPKKAMEKHYHNSTLTRYLKLYLEAKGRMTLVVNVSPCEEDYLDTAFVLRQAAPCVNIRLSLPCPQENVRRLMQQRRGSLPKCKRFYLKRRKVHDPDGKQTNVTWHEDKNIAKEPCTIYEIQNGSIFENSASAGVKDYSSNSSTKDERDEEGEEKCSATFMKGGSHAIDQAERISDLSTALYLGEELKKRILSVLRHAISYEKQENLNHITMVVAEALEEVFEQHRGVVQGLHCQIQNQKDEINLLTRNLDKERELSDCLSKKIQQLEEHNRTLEHELLNPQNRISLTEGEPKEISVLPKNGKCPDFNDSAEDPCVNFEVIELFTDHNGDVSPILADTNNAHLSSKSCSLKIPNSETGVDKRSSTCSLATCEEQGSPPLEQAQLPGEQTFPLHFQQASDFPGNESEVFHQCCLFEDSGVCTINVERPPEEHFHCGEEGLLSPNADNSIHYSSIHSHHVLPEGHQFLGDVVSGGEQKGSRKVFELYTSIPSGLATIATENFYSDKKSEIYIELAPCVEETCEVHVSSGFVQQATDCPSPVSQENPQCMEGSFLISEPQIGDGHVSYAPAAAEAEQPCFVAGLTQPSNNPSDKEQYQEAEIMLSAGHSLLIPGDVNSDIITQNLPSEILEKKHSLGETISASQVSNSLKGVFLQQSCGKKRSASSVTREAEHQNICMQRRYKSHLQKGRLLALSLTADPDNSYEREKSEEFPVLSMPLEVGAIGKEIQEILGLSVSEIENGLWNNEEKDQKRVAALLAEHGGILDINSFKKKFSIQRSMCIRYCLAVICGKINLDRHWVPLSEAHSTSRRELFGAIVRARTIGEATSHVRIAYEKEGFVKGAMTPARWQFSAAKGSDQIVSSTKKTVCRSSRLLDRKNLVPKELLIDLDDESKENPKQSPNTIPKKKIKAGDLPVAKPFKRRKLQPASSLSLNGISRVTERLDSMELVPDALSKRGIAKEDNESIALMHERTSLAYLLRALI